MAKNKENNHFDWMKYRILYFTISGIALLISIVSLVRYGLKTGVEFRGGVEITYKTDASLEEFSDANIQPLGNGKYVFKFENITPERRAEIGSKLEELNYQLVGPSISQELIKKTIYAVIISAGAILIWVAFQFKSIKYGAAAILAMLHDSLILLGSFSIFGFLYNAEVDFLFITAVLTTLTFSVHDTIVVFDRIRELGKTGSNNMIDIANKAVSETMRRSIINSLTIIFMLLSLVILGGESIRWFAVALLVGAISGTYSSPFVAIPLLVLFDKLKKK